MLDTVVIAESGPASGADVLSPAALVFLSDLVRTFRARIQTLRALALETEPLPGERRAAGFDGTWRCVPPPELLAGPRVDLVGPADTASITSALSSHATAFIADLDDAMLPWWRDLLDAQALLRNIHRRAPRRDHPAHAVMPPIFLQPRSILVDEEHVFVDGEPVPAGLVDVGLYCFHHAAVWSERIEGPWLSLTKLSGRVDARVWSDIALWIEQRLGIHMGSIKLSVRIDTPGALEDLDHILWTLRSRVIGVVCGRFELVRNLIAHRAQTSSTEVTPGRSFLTVDRLPLASAAARIVEICGRRGVQAIGPLLLTTGASRSTFAQVYVHAARQARCGFNGTRVVDAELVLVARAALATNAVASEAASRVRPRPVLTEAAVRENIAVALVHLGAVFGGQPRVRLEAHLEDSASARAARAQLWEWLRRRVSISETERLDRTRFLRFVFEESARLASPAHVRALLEHICTAERAEVLAAREERLQRDLTSLEFNARTL